LVLVRIESQRFYRDPPKFRGLHDAICKACATHEQRKQATEIVACTGCGFKIYHPPYNGQILMRRGMGLQNTTLVDDFTCSERCYRRRLIIRQAQRVKIRVCEVDKKEFKTTRKTRATVPTLAGSGLSGCDEKWLDKSALSHQTTPRRHRGRALTLAGSSTRGAIEALEDRRPRRSIRSSVGSAAQVRPFALDPGKHYAPWGLFLI
jgi:hypothetical protein